MKKIAQMFQELLLIIKHKSSKLSDNESQFYRDIYKLCSRVFLIKMKHIKYFPSILFQSYDAQNENNTKNILIRQTFHI